MGNSYKSEITKDKQYQSTAFFQCHHGDVTGSYSHHKVNIFFPNGQNKTLSIGQDNKDTVAKAKNYLDCFVHKLTKDYYVLFLLQNSTKFHSQCVFKYFSHFCLENCD